jgi:hypothetical protein
MSDSQPLNGLHTLKPNNMTAFVMILVGITVLIISVAALSYRLPNTTLPTAEELYTIENINTNKTLDFSTLYNNHVKPTLEDKLLNNKGLFFDKKSTTSDLLVSLFCCLTGCAIIYFGVSIYPREINSISAAYNVCEAKLGSKSSFQ